MNETRGARRVLKTIAERCESLSYDLQRHSESPDTRHPTIQRPREAAFRARFSWARRWRRFPTAGAGTSEGDRGITVGTRFGGGGTTGASAAAGASTTTGSATTKGSAATTGTAA